jgi:hypothetical protein
MPDTTPVFLILRENSQITKLLHLTNEVVTAVKTRTVVSSIMTSHNLVCSYQLFGEMHRQIRQSTYLPLNFLKQIYGSTKKAIAVTDDTNIWNTKTKAKYGSNSVHTMNSGGARTRRFITAFTTARQRSLSWARWIHSTPPPPTNLPKVHFDPIYASVFQVVFFLSVFPPNPLQVSPLSHACHMPRPLHSPLFDLPNNIRWCVQIMKLPTVQLFPIFRYFIPLIIKCTNK